MGTVTRPHEPAGPRSLPWGALTILLLGTLALNVVGNVAVEGGTYVVVNLLGAAALVVVVRRTGRSWEGLGLATRDVRAGVVVGLTGALAVVALVAALSILLVGAGLAPDVGGAAREPDLVWTLAVRIPLGTALAEELVFRSALLGLLLPAVGRARAVLASAILFGLWHVLPTLDAGSAVSGGAVAVLVAVAATTGAGVVLAWLRLRAGSVLAPVLVHAAVNGSALVAALVLS